MVTTLEHDDNGLYFVIYLVSLRCASSKSQAVSESNLQDSTSFKHFQDAILSPRRGGAIRGAGEAPLRRRCGALHERGGRQRRRPHQVLRRHAQEGKGRARGKVFRKDHSVSFEETFTSFTWFLSTVKPSGQWVIILVRGGGGGTFCE